MTRTFYPKIARQEKTSMEQEEPEQNGLGEGLHAMTFNSFAQAEIDAIIDKAKGDAKQPTKLLQLDIPRQPKRRQKI